MGARHEDCYGKAVLSVADQCRALPGTVRTGVLAIAAAALAALILAVVTPAFAKPQTFELINGDILRGEVLEQDEHRVVIQHAILGRLEIPIDQIAPSSFHPGLAGTDFLAGWTKELSIGLGGSQGDTNEADLRVAFKVERLDEHRRWQLDGRYALSFTDKEVDDNYAHITLLRDWLWTESRWFAFAYGIYDFDEFEAWEHRPTLGVGPGYHLVTGPVFNLDSRFGPFITYEFGDVDAARPEAAVGFFATWKFGNRHSLALSNTYLQTLDESEFRDISKMEWKIRFALANALSLKLSIDNEYDSASDQSKNNLNYVTAIAVDF